MFSRTIVHRYIDPLDRVWLSTLERIGLRVERTDAAYATTNGRGTVYVGAPHTLDPDDCLAQILFHEVCHAIVQGEANREVPDWGLDNTTERDRFREHACLRLQAALAARHGLRRFLAPTTDYREFYDALPKDPFEGAQGDESIALARAALACADHGPWRTALAEALSATARIVAAARPFATDGDLLSEAPRFDEPRHPTGLTLGPLAERCGTCSWFVPFSREGRGRCRLVRARVGAPAPACLHWEGALDCTTCGACCREAYGAVEVNARELVVLRHPDLVERAGERMIVRREGPRCAALDTHDSRYNCRIYEDRPKTCRDFERGGRHCLDARQRVGLAPRIAIVKNAKASSPA